jgi:Protein of unknown function (DUF2950)
MEGPQMREVMGMLEVGMSRNRLLFASRNLALCLATVIGFTACNSSKPPQESSIRTFSSPEDAGEAIASAIKSGDANQIPDLMGPGSKEVILSGDSVADQNAANAFARRYAEMHRWRKMPDGSMMLLIGADNFPFAIPLKENSGGKWYFDLAAGQDELLSRRIGGNELDTVTTCLAVVDAQRDYMSQVHEGSTTRQYALKFISDEGKQNGLYWKSPDSGPDSPLGPLAAFASSEGYKANPNAHTAFHGYYFKMLSAQGSHAPGGQKNYIVNGNMTGGFAVVAYPAVYGNSGIVTFMVNQDGVVLEKDLGKDTTAVASGMTTFDPDSSWKPFEF